MKLAVAYSTKDQTDLTRQTFARLKFPAHGDLYWCDGSRTDEGRELPGQLGHRADRVFGGADAGIAWKLSYILNHGPPQHPPYTHIMLLENDVLLDEDWYEPTINLFREGLRDGLVVGAVSARSYCDRVLIQRDGYACMHNIGAGMVVFTRQAAEIVLRTFRTHWWPDNVKIFAQLAGIDLRTYAAFRGSEQWVTTDWGWEAQLARHGLASLALTPARCQMIGQNPSLREQGLVLTTEDGQVVSHDDDSSRFMQYRKSLKLIREGDTYELPGAFARDGAAMLFFPHQLGALDSTWQGTLELQWSQGYGPFSYRAGPGGASLSVHISGSASFQCSGGIAGATVTIEDRRSGFRASPHLPPATEVISIAVPGGPIPRQVTVQLAEGAVFYGLLCNEPQMIDTTWKFDWQQLPEAK